MQKLIEFTTQDKLALEMFPPVPASAVIPDWYRTLPLTVSECTYKDRVQSGHRTHGTQFSVKGCIPILDYLTSGYVLRLHTDVGFTVEEVNGEEVLWWYTGNGPECVSMHHHVQLPVQIGDVRKSYVKLSLPWSIKVPSGYSCLFYQPEFLFNEHLRLLPAIVDCDTYTQQINFPGYFLKQGSFKLEAGTPLVVVMPYKRDAWASNVKFAQEANSNPITRYFDRGYKKLFHSKKSFK